MNVEAMMDLIAQFRIAYGQADRDGLHRVITLDFEWHQHVGDATSSNPTGRVVKGIDGLMQELAWRKENWTNVVYRDLVERPAGDVILQMFTVSGTDETGRDFHVNAVDIYPVRDGRIYRKDTYWKNLT